MALEMSGDVRGWFYERLGLVLRRHAAEPSDTTRLYLVELLARYATQPPGPAFGEPLAFQLAQAMEAAVSYTHLTLPTICSV